MRTCTKCLVEKSIDNFRQHRQTKIYDDLCADCKEARRLLLMREASARNYQQNKERYRAKHKEYAQNNREKMNEYSLKWRQNNPEQYKQIQHNYHVKNKESIALYDKTRRENNIEKFLEKERLDYIKHKSNRQQRLKNWHARNPHMITAYAAGRRAARKQRTPKWLTEDQIDDINFIYMLSGLMSKTTGIQHHVDHIVPLRGRHVSGLHVPWNLTIIPAKDNLSKNNKFTPGRQTNATATQ